MGKYARKSVTKGLGIRKRLITKQKTKEDLY